MIRVNWSYVLAVVILFGGLAAINELTSSNIGWWIALTIVIMIVMGKGIGVGPVTWLLDWLTGLTNRAKGGT
jgi:hypothetical protein